MIRIISGGQTGVDRAALDAAAILDLPSGGWCPKGRRSDDGEIPERYLLRETYSEEYSQRTEWNVKDSEATLVLSWGNPVDGTLLAVQFAEQMSKKILVIDFEMDCHPEQAVNWILTHGISVLNVAGPRESFSPGKVYDESFLFLKRVFSFLKKSPSPNGFGIWLMPPADEKQNLEKIIAELSSRYGSPYFQPHLTLSSPVNIRIDDAMERATCLANISKPCMIRPANFRTENSFFRSLSLQFQLSSSLAALRENAQKCFQFSPSNFSPHLSLLYGIFAENSKPSKRELESLSIPEYLTVSSVYLVSFQGAVGEWQVIKEFGF